MQLRKLYECIPLYPAELRRRIEAWALLYPLDRLHNTIAVLVGTEIPVASYPGIGVELAQVHHQQQQSIFLILRAGVLRPSLHIHAANIYYTYAMLIESANMCAYYIHIATLLHGTVQPDYVVIPDVRPALCLVHTAHVVSRKVRTWLTGRTVYYNIRNNPFALPEPYGSQLQ